MPRRLLPSYLLGLSPLLFHMAISKSSNPFYPTLLSTKERIRSECQTSGPKEVVASLSLESGGITDASYPGELPRDEQQVSGFKKSPPGGDKASRLYACIHIHERATVIQD